MNYPSTHISDRIRHQRSVTRIMFWSLAVLVLLTGGAFTAMAQPDSVSYIELQKKYLTLGNELDSLRTLLYSHGSTLFYLNQSDSAGLWENPYVQKQIDDELKMMDARGQSRSRMFFIGMIAFGVGMISLVLLLRMQFAKRVAVLERRFETMNRALAHESEQHTIRCLEHHEKQLKTLNENRTNSIGSSLDDIISVDHGLPLRVADEIHRMRKRIQYMPEESQSVKALSNSLRRLEEELNTGGYEVVELLGKKYVDGLNVEARFVPAEDASIEGEIITEVVRPQVNYMGVMIQQAKVEVSKSYS